MSEPVNPKELKDLHIWMRHPVKKAVLQVRKGGAMVGKVASLASVVVAHLLKRQPFLGPFDM